MVYFVWITVQFRNADDLRMESFGGQRQCVQLSSNFRTELLQSVFFLSSHALSYSMPISAVAEILYVTVPPIRNWLATTKIHEA